MSKQRDFMFVEPVVVIGIIAILSAIDIPAYRSCLRKAALADIL